MSKFAPRLGRSHFRAGLLTFASLTAVTAWATPALAQDAAAADDGVIIVTAQMREQNVQDIPLAITAVSGEMLEARGQERLDEITAQAPGVQLQKSPFGNSMSAYIRGVGQGDASPSVEPGVGIYVDDVYFGTLTASAFDLVDLERVEVLRGPQGTLAGMNSQGGAIKIYSRKPEGDGGYVEGTLGTLGRRDFRATADFTVVEDAVYARLTGVTRNRDGHVTTYNYACLNPTDPDVISGAIPAMSTGGSCETGEQGNQHMYGMRGSLRIAPAGSPLEVNLIADYTKDTSSSNGLVLIASAEYSNRHLTSIPFQGVAYDHRFVTHGQYRRPNAVLNDFYASYANFYDPGVTYMAATTSSAGGPGTAGAPNGPLISENLSSQEGWGASATIDYELSDNLALKAITGYRTYDEVSGSDNDASPVAWIGGTSWNEHEQFSQEVRLSGQFADGRINATIGGIYYDASSRPLARIHSPFSGFGEYQTFPCGAAAGLPNVPCVISKPTFSFLNDDTADSKVLAAFANAAIDLTDSLSLEGGIRVTDEKKDYTFGRINPSGVGDFLPLSNPQNPLTGFVGSYSATVVDYRAVVMYKLTDEVMAYAQFATGHKGGGISPRPYSYFQIRPFGPENLRSYELGFKADMLDRRVRLNGAAFYMEYIGYQGTPQVCLGLDNQPLPVDQGGVSGLCGQYLNIGDAEVKGFELEGFFEPVDGLTIDTSLSLVDFTFSSITYPTTSIVVGATRPGIGDWKWSVGAQYVLDLGTGGTLTPRIDVNYTPGYCGTFLCEEISKTDSFTIANARVTYQTDDRDWSVSLEASNLFDKQYYVNKFSNVWYTTGQAGRPREVAVTVRRNF